MSQIIDAIIIVTILSFAVVGAKNGFFKEVVIVVGTILILVLAYQFKDYIANFLSYIFPFFEFGGPIKGLTSLNIILYQSIGFIITLMILASVLLVLIKISGFLEKVLNFTIILGIPSKVLGFLVGLVEGYVIAFIALFFLSQPAFNLKAFQESKYVNTIVNSSLILSSIVGDTNDTIKEVYELVKDYSDDKNIDKFNRNSIDVMLKNKMISVDYVDTLIDKEKISISNINTILDKYR